MKYKKSDVEKRLASVKASMAYEGLDIDKKDMDDCKKILLGKITADESCKAILDKYRQKS